MYLGIPEAFYRISFRSYTNKAFWESPGKFSHRRLTGWRYRLLTAKCAGFPNRRKEMVESSKFDSQAHCVKARRLICYYLLTKCWSSNKEKDKSNILCYSWWLFIKADSTVQGIKSTCSLANHFNWTKPEELRISTTISSSHRTQDFRK